MRALIAALILAVCLVGVAFAKTGFDFSFGFGSGSATVDGPVTPSGHFLLIDGAGNYLLIDNASHKLFIDGAS